MCKSLIKMDKEERFREESAIDVKGNFDSDPRGIDTESSYCKI